MDRFGNNFGELVETQLTFEGTSVRPFTATLPRIVAEKLKPGDTFTYHQGDALDGQLREGVPGEPEVLYGKIKGIQIIEPAPEPVTPD